MCGITGFWSLRGDSLSHLQAMTARILHRGPDSDGHWMSPDQQVGLGHRRLAIVDLTPTGYQPMHSHSGRLVLSFNGEIYNFPEMKARVEAIRTVSWRGTSDTEVLLEAFEHLGIEKTLDLADGMFALALWDTTEKTLILARDRLGEKPLYYGNFGDTFLFGSELKALKGHPAFRGKISRIALGLLMRYAYVPNPLSIYEGVNKLQPGHWVKIQVGASGFLQESHCYWDLRKQAYQGFSQPVSQSFQESTDQIHRLLKNSVSERMMADVPLGAFLSGGIDSSLTVALMQSLSSRPVKTFSIGFEFSEYDEAPFAREMAKALQTEHTDMYVSAKEAMDVIPMLPAMYDEPFADSSQIPTYLVSKIARDHVTVSLSGDAGDELFGGYTRYFLAAGLWNRLKHLGPTGRRGLAQAISMVPAGVWNTLGRIVPSRLGANRPAEKAAKFVNLLRGDDSDAYLRFVTYWDNPWEIVPQDGEEPLLHRLPSELQALSFENQCMLMDMEHYLTDDILVKVDRAAMAVSLESRVPFLDREVMEAAFCLPLEHKMSRGRGKLVLREILKQYVPEALFERPKQGFGIPLEHWLRGDLREWAEDLLEPSRMMQDGYLNPVPIQNAWKKHLSGQANRQYPLWPVLMFQAWLRAQ